MLSPLAFPPADAASFFSRTLIEAPEVVDFVALYVPSNPFSAMADNLVPAVVLFSILLGIGLSGAAHSGGLLTALDTLTDALNRVNKLVIKLTPLGVFAIAAGTAGTMSLEELGRLQGFLISYTLLVAAVTFVVLPLLVSAVTPFTARGTADGATGFADHNFCRSEDHSAHAATDRERSGAFSATRFAG